MIAVADVFIQRLRHVESPGGEGVVSMALGRSSIDLENNYEFHLVYAFFYRNVSQR